MEMTLQRPAVKKPSPEVLNKIKQLEDKFKGKIVAIESESGDYFLGDTVIQAYKTGQKKYPACVFYYIRLGYPAVDFHRGGIRKL